MARGGPLATLASENKNDVDFRRWELQLTMRERIKLKGIFDHKCLLSKSAFFAGRDKRFLRDLGEDLTVELFAPGQVILQAGDVGDTMYFLNRGEVAIFVGPTEVATLKSGSVFGEGALFGNGKRGATVKAKELCDCRIIHHRRFHQILKRYPEEKKFFEKLAEERLAQTNQVKKEHKEANDKVLSKRGSSDIRKSLGVHAEPNRKRNSAATVRAIFSHAGGLRRRSAPAQGRPGIDKGARNSAVGFRPASLEPPEPRKESLSALSGSGDTDEEDGQKGVKLQFRRYSMPAALGERAGGQEMAAETGFRRNDRVKTTGDFSAQEVRACSSASGGEGDDNSDYFRTNDSRCGRNRALKRLLTDKSSKSAFTDVSLEDEDDDNNVDDPQLETGHRELEEVDDSPSHGYIAPVSTAWQEESRWPNFLAIPDVLSIKPGLSRREATKKSWPAEPFSLPGEVPPVYSVMTRPEPPMSRVATNPGRERALGPWLASQAPNLLLNLDEGGGAVPSQAAAILAAVGWSSGATAPYRHDAVKDASWEHEDDGLVSPVPLVPALRSLGRVTQSTTDGSRPSTGGRPACHGDSWLPHTRRKGRRSSSLQHASLRPYLAAPPHRRQAPWANKR